MPLVGGEAGRGAAMSRGMCECRWEMGGEEQTGGDLDAGLWS